MIRKKKGLKVKTKREKAGYPRRVKTNIPDEYDELIRQAELALLGKNLDSNGRPKPTTEKQLVALCVKAVRQKWMKDKNKLHFLLSKQLWDTNPNTRTLKKWKCNHCGELFSSDFINVDHIEPAGECTTFEQFFVWASKILDAGGDKDLQILCIPCHNVKTLMEGRGITDWNEGRLLKKVINCMDKKADEQKDELKSFGYLDSQIKNAKMREECYKQLVEEGKL